jgi:transcriptional regulator with XRE-family HTH domain
MLEPWVALSALRRTRVSRGISLLRVAVDTGIPAGKLSAAERLLARLTPAERRVLGEYFGTEERLLFEEVAQ